MTERLLQFIWQFQYFNRTELAAINGDEIQIIAPGFFNRDQGPDFSNAKIKIGNTTWAGTVELHVNTSDWNKHFHGHDRNYTNVILHVVWKHDDSPNTIPVLELQPLVSNHLLDKYEVLMQSQGFIACEKMTGNVKAITWQSWKERLVAERLLRKSAIAKELLSENNHHWEESFWWLLARNFGMKVNAAAFEEIARSVPVTILAKHKQQIHQIEALLFGQAGLLNTDFEEEYPKLLQREYRFLANKYKLTPIHQPVHFLRMRPGNFPTVRLAQLAMLVKQSAHLFSKIKETEDLKTMKMCFAATANDYWHYHYRFDEPGSYKEKTIGAATVENILINTVIPFLFAYGSFYNEQTYKDKALQWLEELKAEANSITNGFAGLGIENKNAFDSQALIELKNEYCTKKRCLECSIGNALLKQLQEPK